MEGHAAAVVTWSRWLHKGPQTWLLLECPSPLTSTPTNERGFSCGIYSRARPCSSSGVQTGNDDAEEHFCKPFSFFFFFFLIKRSLPFYSLVSPLKLKLSSSAIVPKVSAFCKENKQANKHTHMRNSNFRERNSIMAAQSTSLMWEEIPSGAKVQPTPSV